jgi:hypothetical protein
MLDNLLKTAVVCAMVPVILALGLLVSKSALAGVGGHDMVPLIAAMIAFSLLGCRICTWIFDALGNRAPT